MDKLPRDVQNLGGWGFQCSLTPRSRAVVKGRQGEHVAALTMKCAMNGGNAETEKAAGEQEAPFVSNGHWWPCSLKITGIICLMIQAHSWHLLAKLPSRGSQQLLKGVASLHGAWIPPLTSLGLLDLSIPVSL